MKNQKQLCKNCIPICANLIKAIDENWEARIEKIKDEFTDNPKPVFYTKETIIFIIDKICSDNSPQDKISGVKSSLPSRVETKVSSSEGKSLRVSPEDTNN